MRRVRGTDALLTGAVFGGGAGAVGLGWGLLLRLEARLARRAIPRLEGAPVPAASYGDDTGHPLRLALLGDSTAAGVGADEAEDTPGVRIATALAAATGRRVDLDVLAISGSTSPDLEPQVSRALLTAPDVAVLSIGANDITHNIRFEVAVRAQCDAVSRLRAAGVEVVVGTCPDLGAIRPIPQPLRAYAGRRSRRLAAAQQEALERYGARVVPLAALLADRFHAEPTTLFCSDRFHPSAQGYRLFADALLPAVLAAAEDDRRSSGGTAGAGGTALR